MTNVQLPKGYKPSADEEFMNDMQKEYFRQRLLTWREELLKDSEETLNNLKDGGMTVPDISDRASAEADKALELRTRDRMRKVISKIDVALGKIDDGTYGFLGANLSTVKTTGIVVQEMCERLENHQAIEDHEVRSWLKREEM